MCPGFRSPRLEDGCQWEPLGAHRGKIQDSLLMRLQQAKAGAASGDKSLRSHFSELDSIPCSRIFLVRKIQKLGLDSADFIRSHFSTYGHIEKVLVSHSQIMSARLNFVKRVRPSNLAIVVMANEQGVEAVHSAGTEHCIAGCLVFIDRYERRAPAGFTAFEASVGSSTGDGFSMGDGGSSGTARSNPDSDQDEEACISGDFQYWATDDEGF